MSYIVYGYDEDCTLDFSTKQMVILIEPRKKYIDKFKNNVKNSKIILVTKALSENNKMMEGILAFDENKNIYYIDNKNYNYLPREKIYTTSLQNIIREYNIQNIDKIFINLNVDNINNLITSINSYNHLICNILFKSCVDREKYETNNVLNLFERQKTISETKYSDWVCYSHKNLGIELPKICMVFTKVSNTDNNKIVDFIKKYKMDVLIDNKLLEFDEIKNGLPKINIDGSLLFTKNLLNNLDLIFKSDKQYDIVIAFNGSVLQRYPDFYILNPLKDDTLYINRDNDVIYSTKNGMYMLYQILHSNYFNDWVKQRADKRPTLVKFFIRGWFYEYIQKSFQIKNIP